MIFVSAIFNLWFKARLTVVSPEGGYFLIRLQAVGGEYGMVAIDDVSLAYGSCSDIDALDDGKIYCNKITRPKFREVNGLSGLNCSYVIALNCRKIKQ